MVLVVYTAVVISVISRSLRKTLTPQKHTENFEAIEIFPVFGQPKKTLELTAKISCSKRSFHHFHEVDLFGPPVLFFSYFSHVLNGVGLFAY